MEPLVDGFASEGFSVAFAESIKDYKAKSAEKHFDLAIIEVLLPDGSGYSIARSLFSESATKIVILTARDELADRVASYQAGADIHLGKPRAPAEMLAIAQALLRRRDAEVAAPNLGWRLSVNMQALMSPAGGRVDLNPREINFLSRLICTPGETAPTAELMKLAEVDREEAFRMFTSRLRNKIKTATGMEPPIKTVLGEGMAFYPR